MEEELPLWSESSIVGMAFANVVYNCEKRNRCWLEWYYHKKLARIEVANKNFVTTTNYKNRNHVRKRRSNGYISQIRTLLQVKKTGIVLESSLEFRNFSKEPRKQIADETSERSLELTWQFLVRTAKNKSLAGNLRSSKSMSRRNMRGSRIEAVANF